MWLLEASPALWRLAVKGEVPFAPPWVFKRLQSRRLDLIIQETGDGTPETLRLGPGILLSYMFCLEARGSRFVRFFEFFDESRASFPFPIREGVDFF